MRCVFLTHGWLLLRRERRTQLSTRAALPATQALTAAVQNALLASEARCDKLRKELEHSQHNKQNLLQWKLSRAPLLDELEAKVAKYTLDSKVISCRDS